MEQRPERKDSNPWAAATAEAGATTTAQFVDIGLERTAAPRRRNINISEELSTNAVIPRQGSHIGNAKIIADQRAKQSSCRQSEVVVKGTENFG